MTWLGQEPLLRLLTSVGVFALMALWEILAPRRPPSVGKLYRWVNNLGVIVLNSVLVRLVFPAATVGVALFAESHGWGLLTLLSWPDWLILPVGVILLDFAIWVQHVLFHAVPALWRLHRMHHADQDFDVTTGLRFHPIEILLSMAIKAGVIVMLGIPAVAVLVFEILLNATSMFNHGNVRIPSEMDRVLRWFVVTPDMHRVHHSWYPGETNSNFGFNLPWWDRLLGTYRAEPRDGHLRMTIGINQFREHRDLRLDRLLIQPFVGPSGSYPIPVRAEDRF
jgi:sterol desaturase/sphingolipid hydroxylase (fatty acid hydroxylase superfamily)